MTNSDQVKNFWKYMQSEYGSTVVPKNTSEVMKAAAVLLNTLNIQDQDTFMKRFTTTLGRHIYIPFSIGADIDSYSLWGQVRVCVHEHQHIEQGDRDGWVTFGVRYLTSSSFRASYEAEALGCEIEMEYWKSGPLFDCMRFANDRPLVLKNYGCSDDDIDMVRQILQIRAGIVIQGGIETRSAKRAIAWLDNNAPKINW